MPSSWWLSFKIQLKSHLFCEAFPSLPQQEKFTSDYHAGFRYSGITLFLQTKILIFLLVLEHEFIMGGQLRLSWAFSNCWFSPILPVPSPSRLTTHPTHLHSKGGKPPSFSLPLSSCKVPSPCKTKKKKRPTLDLGKGEDLLKLRHLFPGEGWPREKSKLYWGHGPELRSCPMSWKPDLGKHLKRGKKAPKLCCNSRMPEQRAEVQPLRGPWIFILNFFKARVLNL